MTDQSIAVGDTVTWTPPRGRRYREAVVVQLLTDRAVVRRTETSRKGLLITRHSTLPLSELTRKDAP